MKTKNILIFLLLWGLLSACKQSTSKNLQKKDHLLTEKDLIPEGTAYNKNTNTIYIGSIYKQKILSILPNGKIKDVFIKDVFDNMSPIGMEVDENTNTLWVNVAAAPIVNQSKSMEWKTTIMAFNLDNNKLIKRYNYINTKQGFLNDITVTNTGDVYATETVSGKVYKIDKTQDTLKPFVDLKGFNFPNGITFYKSKNALFVSTNEGILKIDIATKKITLLETNNNINAKVIDGLAINDNYFIGHQSSKISKFYFNKKMTKIIDVEILDSGNEFDSSTTGELGNGFYHYIVNSQIKSGVNQKEKTIKPIDSLETIIIRSKKL